MSESAQIEKRLKNLEEHLKEENEDNPVLFKAVKSYRKLDEVARQLGILTEDQSYATRVSWWPMISVLGTFSAGKSTFINSYIGSTLQRTGTQAVDDKFTVLCYSNHETKTLPGVALDADPRFPFYQVSRNIAEMSDGGQRKIDAFLQLKTCPSEAVRGKILIDSPGFDADRQRKSTLRLTEHIIDLSDLVLVFFDARHPEPGAMADTLEHLVSKTIDRPDSNKFIFILNQMDIAAREDNPEEVVAAWQRSLAQAGLTAGRFFRIYNEKAAVPIDDPKVRERFESKRAADMEDIELRMSQVDVERSYRLVGTLEQKVKEIENRIMPSVSNMLQRWKKRVMITDGLILTMLAVVLGIGMSMTGTWDTVMGWVQTAMGSDIGLWALIAVVVAGLGYLHFSVRKFVARKMLERLELEIVDEDLRAQYVGAFTKSTAAYRPMFLSNPAGWGESTRERLAEILGESNEYVQALNDRFTNPSGKTKEDDVVRG